MPKKKGNPKIAAAKPKLKKTPAAKIGSKAKPKSNGKGPSHKQLGDRLQAIGEELAQKLGSTFKGLGLDASPDMKLRYVEKIIDDLQAGRKPLKPDKFGGMYRRLWTEQDELVSTSTARDLLKGILDHTGTSLAPAQLERLVQLMDDFSKIRMPTKFVGYALSPAERMQHPTNKAEAMFEDPGKTARQHAELDRQRRQAVVEGMEAALAEAGATAEHVANAGIRAAIAFTLNEMAAPIIASNVRPHALAGGKAGTDYSDDEVAQVQAREHLKAIYVGLGGKQDALPADADEEEERGRAWTRQGKRASSVSPSRPMADLMAV
jgi:hypothetical protein